MRQNRALTRLYDISPLVHPGLPVWPGDAPFTVRAVAAIEAGAAVNLSTIETTPHLGAHADAPFHTDAGGATIEALDLDAYLGPCRLVEVPAVALIDEEHLQGVDLGTAQRLLLKTGSVTDRSRFPSSASAIAPGLAEAIGRAGIRLVGIDTPSIDPLASKTLDAHRSFNRWGVRNLENLQLDGVPPGEYELIALPLKLRGLDASPVRAVLLDRRPRA